MGYGECYHWSRLGLDSGANLHQERPERMHRIASQPRTVTREQAALMALDDAVGFRDMSKQPDRDPASRRACRLMMRAAAHEWRNPTYFPPLVWR